MFRPSSCSFARIWASGLAGSSAISKQSSVCTIFPSCGVTVMSVLFETFLPTVLSKYQGLHHRSLEKFFMFLNASLTLSLVMSPLMLEQGVGGGAAGEVAHLGEARDRRRRGAYLSWISFMWFWSGLPESSMLNSALIRNLPFHAGLSALATDGSFGGVELAQIDLVDEALLLDRLEQRHDRRAGEVEHHAAAVTGRLHELLREHRRVGDRHVLE